jgi:hypothetical protein
MRKAIILLLLFSFCGGSAETSSPQPQQNDQTQPQENTNQNNSQQSNQSESSEQQTQGLTIQTLPDIKEFITNKSDRFFVDFDDIIAGHPYVGKRSPRPHNDAQVYFSNTDPRWREATQASDYPPLYAVADGIIQMAQGNGSYYNVVDHSDADPPWWHSSYAFKLQFAQNNGNVVSFLYQMEGYVIKEDEEFFKDYLLVENGQVVKKGDILGYMYVPTQEEMVGSMQSSSHIAFSIMEKVGPQKEQEMAPAIFTKEIVEQFSALYTNPTEGWESTSYGNDWSRARGLPSSMGWYIGPEEHPFGGEYLDVVFYGDERDADLDPKQEILSTELGFQTDSYIFNQHGYGNATFDLPFSDNTKVDFVVVTNGSPVNLKFIFTEQSGETRESAFVKKPQGMGYFYQYYEGFTFNSNTQLVIDDPENWGWSLAFVEAGTPVIVPGQTRTVQPKCPPGCPPSPNPYKLNQSNDK